MGIDDMALMNVLLHGVKGTGFETCRQVVRNDWTLLTAPNQAREQDFDPMVVNLPGSYCGRLRTGLQAVVPTG